VRSGLFGDPRADPGLEALGGKTLGAWVPVTPRGRDPAGAGSGRALARTAGA
jgi:hypothetical protein